MRAGLLLLLVMGLLAPPAAAPAALTPPAGWSTWNTFACTINATLIKRSADHLVSSGLLAAGYEYILVDDCCAPRPPLPTYDAAGLC